MRRPVRLTLLVTCILWQAALAQQPKAFAGRVFDASNGRGIQNLEIRLQPPANSNLPVQIGNTGQNGVFRFESVAPGRYLLEVFQGPYPLWRQEIDTSRTDRVDIPLERR